MKRNKLLIVSLYAVLTYASFMLVGIGMKWKQFAAVTPAEWQAAPITATGQIDRLTPATSLPRRGRRTL